ncbi:MAG: hypothetical protein LBD66_02295 [Holosporales bacterium]|jgi:hypothetical protein|nr:hypothetical protein [Holosporales bacterium]
MVTFLLSLLFPFFFHLKDNVEGYCLHDISFAFCLLCLLCAPLLFLDCIKKFRHCRLLDLFVVAGGVSIVSYTILHPFLYHLWSGEANGFWRKTAIAAFYLLCLGTVWFLCKKPVVVALCIATGVTAFQYGLEEVRDYGRTRPVADPVQNKTLPRFVRRPNIYLLFLESYPNEGVCQEVYHCSSAPLLQKLRQKGYLIRDDFFVNYNHAHPSFHSLFLMRHHYFDIGKGERIPSEVVPIFQNNRYHVYSLGDEGPPCLYSLRSYANFDSLIESVYRLSFLRKKFFKGDPLTALIQQQHARREALREKILALLDYPPQYSIFCFIFWCVEHVECGQAVGSEKYPKGSYALIRKGADADLERLLTLIHTRDPQAVVILMGAHGGQYYEGIEEGAGDVNARMLALGVSPALVARDNSAVFFAMKGPEEVMRWMKDRVMSPVNFFPYLFAALTDNADRLQNCAPNISYTRTKEGVLYKIAENGIPLEAWKRVVPPSEGEKTH